MSRHLNFFATEKDVEMNQFWGFKTGAKTNISIIPFEFELQQSEANLLKKHGEGLCFVQMVVLCYIYASYFRRTRTNHEGDHFQWWDFVD